LVRGAAAVPPSESNPAAEAHAIAADSPVAAEPTSAADLERLTTLLAETLEKSGYMRRHPANCDPAQLRLLVRRMSLDTADAAVWMGVFRQLLFKLRRMN
jgi:tRNA/rRNA methyltransferase